MAVRTQVKSPSKLFQSARTRWESAGFTNSDARDTKVRAIAQPTIEEIVSLSEEFSRAVRDLQTGSATGKALDNIGALYNKPRFRSTFANVSSTEGSLCFYVTAGVFGDINGTLDIPLTGSIEIWSDQDENEQGERVSYDLEGTPTLPASSSIFFVSAKAQTDGPLGNVGAQVLRSHSFTGYADSGANTLKVINLYPIVNGQGQESDSRYRARLLSHFEGMMVSNYAALQVNSLEVPGVRNVQASRGWFGIGTAGVFVNGPEGRSNERMRAAVQQQLLGSQAPGALLQSLPMVEATMDVELSVKATRTLSNAGQNRVRSTLRQVLLGYLSDAQLSRYVDLDIFRDRAVDALAGTGINLSADGFFNRVYVTRSYGGNSADERNMLADVTYTLEEYEYPALGTLTVNFE